MKNKVIYCIIVIITLNSCEKVETNPEITYYAQIGDTRYNPDVDDANFQFCDSLNVLHKRAYVSYSGGKKMLNHDILEAYKIKEEYKGFTGYLIVRYVVNCMNASGRIRIEALDNEFTEAECPKGLMLHVQTIFKSLNSWEHPIYQGKDYDGYTFHIMKFNNGILQDI